MGWLHGWKLDPLVIGVVSKDTIWAHFVTHNIVNKAVQTSSHFLGLDRFSLARLQLLWRARSDLEVSRIGVCALGDKVVAGGTSDLPPETNRFQRLSLSELAQAHSHTCRLVSSNADTSSLKHESVFCQVGNLTTLLAAGYL